MADHEELKRLMLRLASRVMDLELTRGLDNQVTNLQDAILRVNNRARNAENSISRTKKVADAILAKVNKEAIEGKLDIRPVGEGSMKRKRTDNEDGHGHQEKGEELKLLILEVESRVMNLEHTNAGLNNRVTNLEATTQGADKRVQNVENSIFDIEKVLDAVLTNVSKEATKGKGKLDIPPTGEGSMKRKRTDDEDGHGHQEKGEELKLLIVGVESRVMNMEHTMAGLNNRVTNLEATAQGAGKRVQNVEDSIFDINKVSDAVLTNVSKEAIKGKGKLDIPLIGEGSTKQKRTDNKEKEGEGEEKTDNNDGHQEKEGEGEGEETDEFVRYLNDTLEETDEGTNSERGQSSVKQRGPPSSSTKETNSSAADNSEKEPSSGKAHGSSSSSTKETSSSAADDSEKGPSSGKTHGSSSSST